MIIIYSKFFGFDETVSMSTPLVPGSPSLLRRSMSGNTLANATNAIRRQEQDRNSASSSSGVGNATYRASLVSRYAEDLDRRRRAERAAEDGRTEGNISGLVLLLLLLIIVIFYLYVYLSFT